MVSARYVVPMTEVPPPLPPAPVPKPPPPRRSRRFFWAATVVLVGVGVPAAFVMWRWNQTDPGDPLATADHFVRGLSIAADVDPHAEGGPKTGFEVAYGLLAEQKRQELPFDVFFEDWMRLFEARGLIVDQMRPQKGGRSAHQLRGRRRISYILLMGGESQEYSKRSAIKLDLSLARGGEDFVITDFGWSETQNPTAR
jgi:hypothetical protein